MIVADGNPFDDVERAMTIGPAHTDVVLLGDGA